MTVIKTDTKSICIYFTGIKWSKNFPIILGNHAHFAHLFPKKIVKWALGNMGLAPSPPIIPNFGTYNNNNNNAVMLTRCPLQVTPWKNEVQYRGHLRDGVKWIQLHWYTSSNPYGTAGHGHLSTQGDFLHVNFYTRWGFYSV